MQFLIKNKSPLIRIISFVSVTILLLASIGCNNKSEPVNKVKLITLDPGHFHAALVQKTMYTDVDSVVSIYAPDGNDLKLHLDRINSYNTRTESPTRWKEEVYTGKDFFEKMITEKKGNVVVLSGNNQKKTDYILQSLHNGLNVYADKPMVINEAGFEKLKQAFDVAAKNNLLLYDIMTERYEITSILQRELSMIPELFGQLEKGTPENPAVEMFSDHNFYKNISGNIVVRPAWFMDASQQGNGIVDVTTHLVDLVQWECFPEQSLDYTKDIAINSAKRWPTTMTTTQFKTITKLNEVPSFIERDKLIDSLLKVWSNGEINYTIKGIHAKVTVVWNYQTANGSDTHYSLIRGTKANLIIRQGKTEDYKDALYIEPKTADPAYKLILASALIKLKEKYPGIEMMQSDKGMKFIIPDKLKEGHESHFARVTEKFLDYLKNKNMPAWEVPNMLAKYYTTTKALELALKNPQ
jgi:predicted dehydrogenase